jgi:uncharacterized membrane protein YesL
MNGTKKERAERRQRQRNNIDGTSLKWPGAQNKFALFAQVLWTGLLVTVASLLIVTIPPALAAGAGHLHRHLRAEPTYVSRFFRDWRDALPGGIVIGVLGLLAAALLTVDIALSVDRVVPGWPVILFAGVLALAALLVTLTLAAAHWQGRGSWKPALRSAVASLKTDPLGAGCILATLVLGVLVAWQLPPLVVPGLGCLIFVSWCVHHRNR